MPHFTKFRCQISDPVEGGRRYFTLEARALAYNTTMVLVPRDVLEKPFRNVLTRAVTIWYSGITDSSLGVQLIPVIQIDNNPKISYVYLEPQMTTAFTDIMEWRGLSVLTKGHEPNPEPWITITATGYGANDSMYVYVEGEVW